MNAAKRFISQIIVWLIIWIIIWFGQRISIAFVIDNVIAFILQIILIACIIYYAAPKLLFNKKYILFISISMLAIVAGSYMSSHIFMPPKLAKNPFGPHPVRPPSKFLVHFLFLTISLLIATFLETFLFAQKKEQEMIHSKNQNLQTELKLLKSQINPHFLFNSLNNIYALSVIDSDKTQQSISYLSDMLRYVLYECDQRLVPLEKEIAYIKNYVQLFSLKSSKKYPIKTDLTILDRTLFVAPMLFIPFVENALKHSNIEKIKNTFINIKLHADANSIRFEIENSIPKTIINKDQAGGIGIDNVKKRLSILYPEAHQLFIREDNEVFTVQLNLKVNEKT